MVDTGRFQFGMGLVAVVGTVAAQLAERQGGEVSPLQVATFLPLDVDSVGRILENLADEESIEPVERDGLRLFRIDAPDQLKRAPVDLDRREYIETWDELDDELAEIHIDGERSETVLEQHELIRAASELSPEGGRIELADLEERADVGTARLQSLLNDFDVECFVDCVFHEDDERLEYEFPPIDYPEARYRKNLELLDRLVEHSESSTRRWLWLAAGALMLFLIVFAVRFYAA
ncbi:MAG: hypothetical protein ABEL76_12195 [Bradymonadaceae bacterium]